ncbi:MAG: TlpA family protein disulfide reductase [Thermoguttaceae bacterium]|nr:TlpA family protein disulfide reductase [Thermoguttaceae bacterium]
MKHLNVFLAVAAMCAVAFVSSDVQAEKASPFADVTQAQQICGPKISPDALRGKVVFVEYWGTNCGPCRQSMPHLQEMYAQLGKTGMFCIIGNHVQQYSPETDKFLKEKGITFPVYQHLSLPVNQNFSGIPRAFLFDATGNVVAEGNPMEVANKVPALLQETMTMKKSGILNALASSGVPGGLKHPFADSDLGKFQKTALAMFMPGKPWLANYKKLQKAAESSDNSEAQTAIETLNSYLNDEIIRLLALSKTDPAKAYVSIDKLNRSIKGMNQERALADVVKKLSADKNVKDLSAILLNIADFESNASQMKPAAAKNKAQGLFNSLKTYCDRKNLSKELKKEAYDAARELKQKYGSSASN